MFESWSGYQNNEGAEGPFLVLEVWLTDEDIVRQNAIAFWASERSDDGSKTRRSSNGDLSQSWSGYQNNEGAEGPFLVLEVWLTGEDIVRHICPNFSMDFHAPACARFLT